MNSPFRTPSGYVVIAAKAASMACTHRARVLSAEPDGTYVLMSAPARIDRALEEFATTAAELSDDNNYVMTDPMTMDEYHEYITSGGEGIVVQTPNVQIQAGRPRHRLRWNQRVTYRAAVRCLQASTT